MKSARDERCLPPITWARNISRIAARAESGARTPIFGTTLSARTCGTPPAARIAATSSRASTLPATTTGPVQPEPTRSRAAPSSTSALPPSVPPVSSTTSGSLVRTTRVQGPSSGGRLATPMTATTLPPLLSATRRPASAVTSSSLPTTAIRSPPPALEQASTCASVARASRATSAARHASYPSSTSVSIVVRCAAAATMLPEPRSTSAALVKVEPKSTQTTALTGGVTAGPRAAAASRQTMTAPASRCTARLVGSGSPARIAASALRNRR